MNASSAPRRLAVAPLAVIAYVTAMVVTLALVHPFTPAVPSAAVELGDPYTGEIVYEESCAGCHGAAGAGGVGPALARQDLELAAASARIDVGGGAMPPGLVTGERKSDVLAYLATLQG